MKLDILEKIDGFIKYHQVLSSFICLTLQGFTIKFYWSFEIRDSSYTFVGIPEYFNMVKWSILESLVIYSIPIYFISRFLAYSLKEKGHSNIRIPFYQKILLAFIPSFLLMLAFFYDHHKNCIELSEIICAIVYSIVFALYFAKYSDIRRKTMFAKSFLVNLLMILFYGFSRILFALFSGYF